MRSSSSICQVRVEIRNGASPHWSLGSCKQYRKEQGVIKKMCCNSGLSVTKNFCTRGRGLITHGVCMGGSCRLLQTQTGQGYSPGEE